ncbi:MAG: HsdM family class I SAM-dependent methyltransferase, partial [Thermoleophilaceae bacterium]
MTDALRSRLRDVVDRSAGRYKQLNGAADLGQYLGRDRPREDEEVLTEPLFADLLEDLLGFPHDSYFPQLGRSGLKPDFTPHDLVAHRFVLDAKSSTQDLAAHEQQIRAYIDQRQLDYGVLFNLREIRVYRRGERGHVPELSVPILPLWETAHGQAMSDASAEAALEAFVELFSYRTMGLGEKIQEIRQARSWSQREGPGKAIEIDLDFLVDRLHDLSRALQADAASQFDSLRRQLAISEGREPAMLGELQLLALDLAPGTDLGDLPATVEGYRDDDGLAGRAWRQYLLRVSQLALTRVLLYRSWEDVEFVESYLCDGGFDHWYERLDHNLQEVLRRAFADGRERYGWLYGSDNNYDWYRPRDEALVDVLYALVPVPLGKLDADVLGGLYELYVDDIDRDRLGQFFTPRSVVRFMLDRAGYHGADGVFRLEGDRREPLKVLDFATGSGGFLVEAARRVIDEAGLRTDDERDLTDGLAAILRGFHGGEISPFPYYLTEVNLLLQVSRLLGHLRAVGASPVLPALGVVHTDTLATRRAPNESIEGMAAGSRADRAELERDDRFGLVPLDREKREAFGRMREDGAFDLVVGNPPYVFESNNKVLFDRLRALPAWRDLYRGKSDYLYYFLLLAAEKVAPGGRLCVITPAGWMNAGNAEWLRERLASSLRLDELFLFGSHRLFAPEQVGRAERRHAPTPTVESAILVATKAAADPGHELKIVALEDEAAAAAEIATQAGRRVPDRDALLTHMGERMDGRAGRRRGVNVHRLRQHDLDHELPWPIKHSARDVASQVVAHLDRAETEPLGTRWHVFQGIQTGADAYSARIQKRLSADAQRRLAAEGATTGDPILELPPGRELKAPWKDCPDLLARSVEPHAILYGALDEANYTSLVWIGRDEVVPEPVAAALEPWRPVLATRAELVRNPKRRWFETAWPRDKVELTGPKVIALYRTDRGRFDVDETGDWQPSIKTTLCTPAGDGLSVAYLGGLLNSELLDLWYRVRGKTPRDVWRNYEPKPMARMPYRHVERIASLEESDRLTRLDNALDANDVPRAQALAAEVAAQGSESELAG